jgi:hypothetical protein
MLNFDLISRINTGISFFISQNEFSLGQVMKAVQRLSRGLGQEMMTQMRARKSSGIMASCPIQTISMSILEQNTC